MKRDRQNKGQKVGPEDENLQWELKVAAEADVQPIVDQLTDHMSDQQRQAFLGKIKRYIQKLDRDLILAVQGLQVLGLVCVIDQAGLPPGLSVENLDYLKNFACGTQLLVHSSCRRRGIGRGHYRSWRSSTSGHQNQNSSQNQGRYYFKHDHSS